MKKTILTIFLLMVCHKLIAINYYVNDVVGNDANNGKSISFPFKTIQRAADLTLPGDIVYVMNGTYTSQQPEWSVVHITRSGTASDWITYTNYPNHNPLIFFTGSGFTLANQASYIKINGFIVKGNNDNLNLNTALNQPGSCNDPNGTINPLYNGNGITMWAEPNIEKIHHINITNNTIFNCPAGAIYGSRADYISIENNLLYNNAWYTLYGSSGIALYQNSNFDNSASYRIVIKNNKLMGNYNLVPWLVNCAIFDGNGIIIDDSKHTQNGSTVPAYTGKTLIVNNIIYGSGGPGIHVYESEHVDIINNSVYYNQLTNEGNNGEIDANNSNDVLIRNNIMYSKSDKPINTVENSTNIVVDNNLYFGGNGSSIQGTNAINQNPDFINPSLTLIADFFINSTSPAIDSGSSVLSPNTDFNGNPRPYGNGYDIGAFEFGSTLSVGDIANLVNFSTIYPNPTSDFIFIKENIGITEFVFFDLNGKIVLEKNDLIGVNKIDMSNLKNGLYFLKMHSSEGKTTHIKVLKK